MRNHWRPSRHRARKLCPNRVLVIIRDRIPPRIHSEPQPAKLAVRSRSASDQQRSLGSKRVPRRAGPFLPPAQASGTLTALDFGGPKSRTLGTLVRYLSAFLIAPDS